MNYCIICNSTSSYSHRHLITMVRRISDSSRLGPSCSLNTGIGPILCAFTLLLSEKFLIPGSLKELWTSLFLLLPIACDHITHWASAYHSCLMITPNHCKLFESKEGVLIGSTEPWKKPVTWSKFQSFSLSQGWVHMKLGRRGGGWKRYSGQVGPYNCLHHTQIGDIWPHLPM